MEYRLSPPGDDDLTELQLAVVSVDRLVRDRTGSGLAGDERDLATLQAVLDVAPPHDDEQFERHAMGFVVAQLLAEKVPGVSWTVVEDAAGRELALRWRDTSLVVFPHTLLSKPLGRGEPVNVTELYEALKQQFESLRNQA